MEKNKIHIFMNSAKNNEIKEECLTWIMIFHDELSEKNADHILSVFLSLVV